MSEFKREERYIVVKLKHLAGLQVAPLRNFLRENRVPTLDCVVVESDWPEYEQVWQSIERRMTGQPAVTAAEELEAVLHWRGKHTQAIRERNALQQLLNQRDEQVESLKLQPQGGPVYLVRSHGSSCWEEMSGESLEMCQAQPSEYEVRKLYSERAKGEPVACVIAFREGSKEPEILSWNQLPVGEHRLYAEQPAPVAVVPKSECPNCLGDSMFGCETCMPELKAVALLDLWQPIETAPKDGTEVILRKGDRVTSGAWTEWSKSEAEHHGTTGVYLGQVEYDSGALWASWDGGFCDDDHPTHWQPLPTVTPQQ